MSSARFTRSRVAWFVAAAALYVAGWAVAILTPISEQDAPALAITIAVSLFAGIMARSWWALLLPLVIVPLAAVQPCDTSRFECDVNVWALALMIWAPLSAVIVAPGIAIGKWLTTGSHRAKPSS